MARRNLIYCAVTCRRCNGVSSASGYYSPERIKKLKVVTKDWVEDEDFGILCPECQAELKAMKSQIAIS